MHRQRLELPDGDFLDLDWTTNRNDGPIVILLHGLEGSTQSHYARGMLAALIEQGWRAVVMHFRGCSGEANRLPRSYHSGETGDFRHVLSLLRQREAETPIAAIGFSLGGNVLLKYLGEVGADTPLCSAASVSVPMVLSVAADRLNHGISRLYQKHMIKGLQQSVQRKQNLMSLPLREQKIDTLKTFWDFDDKVTAPLHGFTGAQDYYRHASSRQYMKQIQIPTLLIQSRDDPFMGDQVIPTPEEVSPMVTLEIYDNGGHVGFVAGRWPWRPNYWLERRIPEFLGARVNCTLPGQRLSRLMASGSPNLVNK